MTMNTEKFKFCMTEVTYLDHKLTGEIVKHDQSKVDAIPNMPAPNDKQGVQRLLGMVNYLTKFIQGTAEISTPLRELLKKDVCIQDGIRSSITLIRFSRSVRV